MVVVVTVVVTSIMPKQRKSTPGPRRGLGLCSERRRRPAVFSTAGRVVRVHVDRCRPTARPAIICLSGKCCLQCIIELSLRRLFLSVNATAKTIQKGPLGLWNEVYGSAPGLECNSSKRRGRRNDQKRKVLLTAECHVPICRAPPQS